MALAADSTAAEEHAHAGVLENWVPAFMVEIEPGSAAAAEEHAHAGAGDEGWAAAVDDEDPVAGVVKDASGFRRAGERMVIGHRLTASARRHRERWSAHEVAPFSAASIRVEPRDYPLTY
jgi:hypothetical protein